MAVAPRQARSVSNIAASSGERSAASGRAAPARPPASGGAGTARGPRRLRHRDVAAEQHRPLPAQHLAAGFGEGQRLVLALDGEQALREQLADHAAPFGLAQLLADPEHRQLVVPVARHLVGLAAEQDVDDLPRAEPLVPLPVKPHDGGQHLLRRDRAVPDLRRGQARVAVAASQRSFGKIGEQHRPAAFGCLAQPEHRVQVALQPPPVREIPFRAVDQPPLLDDVGQAVGEPGGRRVPVAARPAGLLVVAFDRPRQVQVGDEADVRLVDPHAERDRRDDHQALLAQEPGLMLGASPGVEAGVVGQGGDALLGEERGDPLRGVPGQAVDDPGVAGVLGPQERQQLALGLVLGDDPVLDVRPVERGYEHPRAGQLQPDRDLLAGRLGGRGGQRDPRHVRPALVQHLQLEVVGAEVVPPLRHAVRLVDREHRDLGGVEQPQGGVGPQPLRREVEQVELAGPELLLDDVAGPRVLRRVEEVGADAELAQRLHLVLHEGDERRDDDSGARPHQRGNLVAQRLAAAGRHQHKRVVARDDVRDDLLLLAPERVVAEHAVQDRRRAPRAVGRAQFARGDHGAILRPRADSPAVQRNASLARQRDMYRHTVALSSLALCLAACGALTACAASAAGTASGAPGSAPGAARLTPAARRVPATPAPTASPPSCGPARRAWAAAVTGTGKVAWQVRLPTDPTQSGVALRPLVTGGEAVFAEFNGVYALRSRDGHELWRRTFPAPKADPYAGMVYGLWRWRGTVVVLVGQVSPASRLVSLNAATGAVRWTLPLSRQGVTGNLTLTADGGLAMIRGYGTLSVADLTTGRLRWSRTAGHSPGPVAVGTVVAGAWNGRAVGYNDRTGAVLWTERGLPAEPALAAADGLVLVQSDVTGGSSPTAVTALAPRTGRVAWRFDPGVAVDILGAGPAGIVMSSYTPDRLYSGQPRDGPAALVGQHGRGIHLPELGTGRDKDQRRAGRGQGRGAPGEPQRRRRQGPWSAPLSGSSAGLHLALTSGPSGQNVVATMGPPGTGTASRLWVFRLASGRAGRRHRAAHARPGAAGRHGREHPGAARRPDMRLPRYRDGAGGGGSLLLTQHCRGKPRTNAGPRGRL